MIFVVFGIPGVGKTSVINGAVEKTGVKAVNFGDILTTTAIEMGLIKERDELRKLSYEVQQAIREKTIDTIRKIHEESKDIILDTHAVIKTKSGYMPGFNQKIITKLFPDFFINVWAAPEDIAARRASDESRNRDKDDVIELEESLRVTRNMAAVYAVLADGIYCEIENKQTNLSHAIDSLINIIESSD